MTPDLARIIEWAFMALVSGSISFAVVFLRKIAESVNKLNVQVATIIERSNSLAKTIETHDEAIKNHEHRIFSLEILKTKHR